MIGKQHFGRIINFLINVVLESVLTYVGLSITGAITSLAFIQSFVVSIAVEYTIRDLISAPAWGQTSTERIGIKDKLGYHPVSTAIGGLVLTICISFFRQLVTVGGAISAAWPHVLPYFLMFGYMVLIIFTPVCGWITGILTH